MNNETNGIENGIIIEAELITETRHARLMNCEGDEEWFPKHNTHFDESKKELTVPKWLLKKKFPNEKY